ncbi:ribosome recycling factor [Sporocytophaga myxococcoides]|uniref:ribosome recycling factor n=1 Tax=Sporocytophaga myxococcoides TaxID=153721 RepID=UPI000401A7C5|nr:ribosome recycling factor [Sporocytophaga myxococcoides]
MEEIQLYLDEAKDSMQKALKHTEAEFAKIRAGKAMPSMVHGVSVSYYGIDTPLEQVSSITTPDAKTILIKPFEKKLISEIEKAIKDSNLGFNPQNDGENIRITLPPLTEERRKALVKQVKGESESGKIAIRNIRKDTNEELRTLQKEGASEDEIKKAEEKVQTLTNDFIAKIDQVLAKKEAEIMTV